MEFKDAVIKFSELEDRRVAYSNAARELRATVTKLFGEVANGGRENPSLRILNMLEHLEAMEKKLQKEIDELLSSTL